MRTKIKPVEIDSEDDDVATYKVGEAKVHIQRDHNPESPREWSNAWKWYSRHRRYSWDKENGKYLSVNDIFDGETEEGESIKDAILRQNPEFLDVHPIYLYEHSGIAISLGSFSDPWDSGVGMYAAITREQAEAEWPDLKGDDDKLKEQAYKCLESEVDTYNKYLDGEVYGYVVGDADGNETNSCWGYYDEPEEVAREGASTISVKDLTMKTFGSVDLVNRINERSRLHIFRVSWVDEIKDGEKRYTVGVRLGFDDGMHEGVAETPVMDAQDMAQQFGYQKGEFEGHCLKVWNETEAETETEAESEENPLDSEGSNG